MGINWTTEKIAQLTLEEVRQLAENAKRIGNLEVLLTQRTNSVFKQV